MINLETLKELLPDASEIARKAGAEIMGIYQTGDFSVESKSDDSPLTTADLASHHCIVNGLEKLQPAFPILSEESDKISFDERSQWKTYWLIDPLDGTKEFIKRNGQFTVNIALIHDHKPVLGVVYVPATDVCYFATQGIGAFKQDGTEEAQRIQVRKQATEKLIIAGSRSHRTGELDEYLEKLGEHEFLPIGSSLKFCLVAEGKADLYPRIGLTCEWDTGAAQAVVECAGGEVINISGEPLLYNTKDSLLNPYFLVFGDNSRDWASYAKK
ncbi:MAG: 3'(2'),5'-bisphosphate nucleotidase [Gammaproteobacteria bacterium]|nr:MAG: 3'(2'),5'-bisphosphate nucleotidase [Gammaproteobacteria bacterium]RLA24132.1 MAG: 3'(2'),5'-bisphosphate nucleotidase [Gammaproteobacteria bacterium]